MNDYCYELITPCTVTFYSTVTRKRIRVPIKTTAVQFPLWSRVWHPVLPFLAEFLIVNDKRYDRIRVSARRIRLVRST